MWIGDSHHAVWGHDYEVIRTEWDCALKEDHSSFEMNKMMVRTNKLLQIKEVTHSKIHTHESEAEVPERKKTLVQLLKQFHAHFYWLFKKGTTHAMVGLQGLHLGEAFKCSNVSGNMGLKSFRPWCLQLGGRTKTIAIHLKEVHYRMAMVCNICRLFASITTQSILDHHSGYKAKYDKECTKCEKPEKVKNSHKKKSKSQGQKEAS